MLLPVALTTAGAAALINFWLGLRIGQVRRAENIWAGDGGNARLAARMRAQSNFAEYVPVVLILIALVEFGAGTSFLLWIAAAVFVIGRLLHPIGMDGWKPGRMVGAITTLLVMVGLAVYAIYLAQQYANPLR